jgi:hypothetical protein
MLRTTKGENMENTALSSGQKILYRISGAAAIACGLLLLISVFLSWNNWLIILFKLHAGFSGIQAGMLKGFNIVDLCVLGLTGIAFISFFFIPKGRVLTIIAIVQPFLGIVFYVSTKLTGRSAVMGGLLVLSIALIRNNVFGKVIAVIGLLASVLLLTGDISESMVHSGIVAVFMGIGYILLITWFLLTGIKLFQISQTDRSGIVK